MNREDIGRIEWLLKTRAFSEKERNNIIDLTNKTHSLVYDKTDKKFRQQYTIHQFARLLSTGYENVVPTYEEENYVV